VSAPGLVAVPPSPALRALVVDDEKNIRATLRMCLASLGCQTIAVGTGAAALEIVRNEPLDLVFCDLRLGPESGIDLIPLLLAERPGLEIVVITAYATVDSAVSAMQRGARDYLPKPFTEAQIEHVVARARERRAVDSRLLDLESRLGASEAEVFLDTAATRMRAALDVLERSAAHDVPVLLRGESGTGKSVLARHVHARSGRGDRPFLTVSCAGLSAATLEAHLFGAVGAGARDQIGRVELAEGGTLVLDEIAELPPELQARLQRFIEERRFERVGEGRTRVADVRIVATTSRDVAAEVASGRLRNDLLHRLNAVDVEVPPLRERLEDIVPLARHFLAFFAQRGGRATPAISDDAQWRLTGHRWPGNVRELRNVIERALILTSAAVVEPENLPEEVASRGGVPVVGGDFSAAAVEREHALRVIARTRTLEEAARILEIDVTTLWRKRKRWGR
jgi:two-component system, NtrC family, response regulator AlgB